MMTHAPVSGISLRHMLVASALAAVIVILPMGHILMPLPWIVVVGAAWHREAKRGRGTQTLITYVSVATLVIIAAVLAPVKTTERMLDRTLTLPKVEMTLAELDQETNLNSTIDWLPRHIWVSPTPEYAHQRIRFRRANVTLREFVSTVESQSGLRHRFLHCGNGSSILFGGDCSFGLHLR